MELTSLIPQNDLFGRHEEMAVLKKRMLDLRDGYRQNMAFLGPEGSGKTFLVRNFIQGIEDEDILPIYLDCHGLSVSEFVTQMITQLLRGLGRRMQEDFEVSGRIGTERLRKTCPRTAAAVQEIREGLNQGKISSVYTESLLLPGILSAETGKKCILVLDEFQRMADWPLDHVFTDLGKAIMTQKTCLYIVLSSSPDYAARILAEGLSLLFGNFETIPLSPFDSRTGVAFIRERLKAFVIKDKTACFLWDFCGGIPLYLSLICSQVERCARWHRQKEVYTPLIFQAVMDLFFEEWGILNVFLRGRLTRLCEGRGGQGVAALLLALAQGKKRFREIVAPLKMRQGLVKARLNRLMEEGLVGKNGSYFFLSDKLFRFWLKEVCGPFREAGGDVYSEKARKVFLERMKTHFEEFCRVQDRDVAERVRDLLHRFEDEVVHLNGRRYRLPHFGRVESLRDSVSSPRFLRCLRGRSEDGDWLVALKEGVWEEGDVQAIKDVFRQSGRRCKRCLVIAMASMDEAARLKALQEKMWIWQERELNFLMDLHNQPMVVME